MRTQFQSLPDSLMDAAHIDGATAPCILFSILLPLSKAVSAVLILFSVVGFWNMWFEPMIFLTQRSMYPLQSVLREILIDSNEHMLAGSKSAVNIKLDPASMNNAKLLIKYANIIVCTVPILAIYPFAQKHFVKGVMIGSLKG
ncbi:MAG: ABC transporter permease subunit [Christensenellales bacterium]